MDMQALMWLISRAELTGSRGRARLYGHVEPLDSDYDWSIFSNDHRFIHDCRLVAEKIVASDVSFKIIERPLGFTLHSRVRSVDVNVKRTIMKEIMLTAWRFMERHGMNKTDAWHKAHEVFGQICED